MVAIPLLFGTLLVQGQSIVEAPLRDLEIRLQQWNAHVSAISIRDPKLQIATFDAWSQSFDQDVNRLDQLVTDLPRPVSAQWAPIVRAAHKRGVEVLLHAYKSDSREVRRAAIRFAASYGGFYSGDAWLTPFCLYTFRDIFMTRLKLDEALEDNLEIAISLLDDTNPVVVANIATDLPSSQDGLLLRRARAWATSPKARLRSLAFHLISRLTNDKEGTARMFVHDESEGIRRQAREVLGWPESGTPPPSICLGNHTA